MAETILVTGAAGTVGSRTVVRLCELGAARIVAGVHDPAKGALLQAAGAQVLQLDLNDPGSVARAVAGADRIFLITPPQLETAQIIQNVLSAAEASRIRRIVRLSVMGAEDEPAITLRRLHRSAELAIMGSNIDWTFLRPNGFMQNFEQYAGAVRSEGAIYQPIGDAKVSYVDAEDIARVAATVLLDGTDRYSGGAFDLTGPEALDRAQVCSTFAEGLGKTVGFVDVSDEAARSAMVSSGMSAQLADALVELLQDYRRGGGEEVSSAVADITGAPATSFARYLQNNRQVYL